MARHDRDFRAWAVPLRGAAIYALFGLLWIFCSDAVQVLLTGAPALPAALRPLKDWFFVFLTACLVYALLHRHGLEMHESARSLRDGKAGLDLLFRALPIGIGTARDRILLSANDRLCEMSGFSREELIGRDIRTFYLDDAEYERVGKHLYSDALRTGRVLLETRWQNKDGRPRDILLGATVDFGGAGPTDLVFSAMDVTEHREQQALYRLVFESAHDALFLMDGPMFVDCNASAMRMYGLTWEELVGSTPTERSPRLQPDGRESEDTGRAYIAAALAGTPQRFEWRHLRGDGTPFDAEISLNRIPLGGKQYLLVTARDITRRKRTEAAQRKSEAITKALYAISNAVSSTRDTDELYATIHAVLNEHIDATNFYIAIVNEAEDRLDFPIFFDEHDEPYDIRDISNPEVKSMTLEVIRTGRPLLVGGAADIEGAVPQEAFGHPRVVGTRAAVWLGVPLAVGGTIIGAMAVQHYDDPRKYGPDDKAWLSAVSEQVALAIDRKQTLEALRQSEDSLSGIFRAVPAGIAVISGRVLTTVNDRFCEIFGYGRDELLGSDTRRLYASEEEYQRCGREIYGHLAERRVSAVECRMVRRDGGEIHVLINSSPLTSEENDGAVISSVLDITDRNRALAALKDNEEYLASIFRIAPTGIAVVQDRIIQTVNDRFAKIFGYRPEELVGQNVRRLYVSEEEYLRCGREYYQSIGQGEACSLEAHGVRKDGEEIFLLVNASTLSRSGQEGLATFCVLDITDLKRTERELREHRDRLEEMVRERTAELTGSNAELQRLIADSENRSRQAAVLNEMGELLEACETEEETYHVAAGVCAKLFQDDAGFIGILEEDNWCIRIVDAWGEDPGDGPEFAHNDCWAIRRGKAHTFLTPGTDPLCNHVRTPPADGSLCIPMNAQGKVLGMTHLRFGPGMRGLGERERQGEAEAKRLLLSAMLERYAPSLVNLRLRESLREQSIRDRLTGLFNRRHMEETLHRELARARRRGTPLGVVMIDVDHFKRFNDSYGHETGDAVLRELGKHLLACVRVEDVACRFGGEELLLILPDGDLKNSLARAEDIRRGIEEQVAVNYGDQRLRVTASLGVASFPVHGEDAETLLAAADAALYRAKEGGRNQVRGAR